MRAALFQGSGPCLIWMVLMCLKHGFCLISIQTQGLVHEHVLPSFYRLCKRRRLPSFLVASWAMHVCEEGEVTMLQPRRAAE